MAARLPAKILRHQPVQALGNAQWAQGGIGRIALPEKRLACAQRQRAGGVGGGVGEECAVGEPRVRPVLFAQATRVNTRFTPTVGTQTESGEDKLRPYDAHPPNGDPPPGIPNDGVGAGAFFVLKSPSNFSISDRSASKTRSSRWPIS